MGSSSPFLSDTHRIHGAIYGNIYHTERIVKKEAATTVPSLTINIPQMLAYIPYMDPMGYVVASFFSHEFPTLPNNFICAAPARKPG